MIQVALEDDQVGLAEVEEQIRRLAMEIPERVTGAPVGVLLVDPSTIALVFLA